MIMKNMQNIQRAIATKAIVRSSKNPIFCDFISYLISVDFFLIEINCRSCFQFMLSRTELSFLRSLPIYNAYCLNFYTMSSISSFTYYQCYYLSLIQVGLASLSYFWYYQYFLDFFSSSFIITLKTCLMYAIGQFEWTIV